MRKLSFSILIFASLVNLSAFSVEPDDTTAPAVNSTSTLLNKIPTPPPVVVCPGNRIESSFQNRGGQLPGTSMATPFVLTMLELLTN